MRAESAGAIVSPRRLILRRFVRHRLAIAGGLVLGILLLASLAAPLVAWLLGHDANAVDLLNRFAPPSPGHPLGTDELGRDLLLRLLYGGQVSLFVGMVGALAAAILGTLIGLLAGFAGGRIDMLLMRLTDAIIALPLLPLLIVLAALDLGKLGLGGGGDVASLWKILLIVALVGWTTTARLVRASTLSVREQDYVRAAVALGMSRTRIVLRHILPNVASPVIVATTLSVGQVILTESVLSFLGLGIQPPLPSWGNMLTGAQELVREAPALAIWPGALIFLTVVGLNFVGDGLQDALDPRAHD